MIRNPLLLCLCFVGLVAGLGKLSAHPALGRFFRVLPVPFWCYFLSTLGSTVGLLPQSHVLYGFLSQQLLPVCLILLLLGTDVCRLARMGPLAALLMLAGSAGTLLGGLAGFALYRRWLPAEAWGGIGALAGSWTGGSANLLAVKEALRVPDTVIAPIILVDTAIAYSWMGLLLSSAALAPRWNRWIGADTVRAEPFGKLRAGPVEARTVPARPSRAAVSALGIAIAVVLSLLAQRTAQAMPVTGAAVTASTWTILLVTTAAVALSLTPLRRLGEAGLSGAGTFALYVLLASIGARASLQALAQAPVFLALGLTWIVIHGLVLLAAGFLARAPLGLIATASQANIGGPISAPIVGATFSKELAIEIKGSSRVHEGDLHALSALLQDGPVKRCVVVSLEKEPRRIGGRVRVLPWRMFLDQLWNGDFC